VTDSRRDYHSPVRAEQLRATRRAVVAAAALLFVRHGYAATTLALVAEEAGVSRRTVFNAVGGKSELLKLAWDQALVGDDEPVAMVDRPAVARILASTDVDESVRLWAEYMTEIAGRVVPIRQVVDAASDADPDVAALVEKSERDRYFGARAFAQHLAGLRPGIDVDRVADVCWAQNDGVLFRRLVFERGWSTAAFAAWLAAVVGASVPRPDSP
jgi:AcrR family transcriptional regulator